MAGKRAAKTKGRGRGRAKTDRRAIEAAERRRQALELRKAGLTYEEIARRLGYAAACGAYKAVKTALAAIPADAVAELRVLEGERLDQLQLGLWPRALAGNPKAVDQVLRIMQRRAAMLGLDENQVSLVDLTSGGKPFECAPGFADWQPPELTKEQQQDMAKLREEIAALNAT